MRILLAIPGHLHTVPMNRFAAKALRSLGHEVLVVDYHAGARDKLLGFGLRALGRREEWAGVNARVRRALRRFRPDLLFTIYGFRLSPQTLAYARKLGVRTACWWINDPFQFERGLKLAPHYDVWFSNSSVCAAEVTAATGVPAHFLPVGCDPELHRPVPAEAALASDLCFAGDWCQAREAVMLRLLEAGVRLRIFGPWEKKLAPDSPLRAVLTPGFFTPEQMVRYFASSRLVLNFHTWFGRSEHGVNPRLFEAAGCGAPQVVDFKPEIPSLFEPGREVAIYRTLDELPGLVQQWLADPARLQAMGAAARERAARDHTYEARMAQMLALVLARTPMAQPA